MNKKIIMLVGGGPSSHCNYNALKKDYNISNIIIETEGDLKTFLKKRVKKFGAFSSAISSIFLPRAIQMTVKNTSKRELTDLFIKISRIILFVLLFILGCFLVIGKDFVFFWVGDKYRMAYYYSLAIMFGLTPALSQGFANNILEVKNLLVYRGKLMLSLTLTGVIISFFVVQKFGAMGMILVTIFFLLLERILIIPYYIKKANLDMIRYYKEISPLFFSILIAIIISLINYFFLPNKNVYILMFNTIAFSIMYFIFCLFVMTKYEKELFKSILIKIPIINKIYLNNSEK